MPKKGHTEEDIIAALKQHESGEKAADICRKLGISQPTFYTCGRNSMPVSAYRSCGNCANSAKRNSRQKRLVADLAVDRQILQEIVAKKL